MQYVLYEIRCKTPNCRYVGITTNLSKRISRHRTGRGSTFTRKHGYVSHTVVALFDNEREAKYAEHYLVVGLRIAGVLAAGANYTAS